MASDGATGGAGNGELRAMRLRRRWTEDDVAVRLHQLSEELGEPAPGVDANQVSKWERGARNVGRYYRPRLCLVFAAAPAELGFEATPRLQYDLEELRCRRPAGSRQQPSTSTASTQEPTAAPVAAGRDAEAFEANREAAEAIDLAAWIEQSNVGDGTIAALEDATHRFAENHTRVPPRRMLAVVLDAHRQVRTLLGGGKQRLRQARDLFRIEADLLAHACILFGDLHDDEAAMAYGIAAALCAEEAGSSPAAVLSAQAKTERWRGHYAASADLAWRGFRCSPPTPLRVMLAGQEANAWGLLGDQERALQALRRAEEAASADRTADSGVTVWSCPQPRQALYAVSVALHANEPEAALAAADAADAGWAAGEPWVYGTWAQLRFAAGIAYLMMGDLDGAGAQVNRVMNMPPEFRLATVTNYLVEMDRLLEHSRFRGATLAAQLREQIRDFNTAALPAVGAIEASS